MHPVKVVSIAMASPSLIRLVKTFRAFMRASLSWKKSKARDVIGRALASIRDGFPARQAGYAAVMKRPDIHPLFCLIFISGKIIRPQIFPWLWGEYLIQSDASPRPSSRSARLRPTSARQAGDDFPEWLAGIFHSTPRL
jgi:hypothetical protein